MEPKRRRNAHAPQRQKGGAKYVRTMLVIGRTMLVMETPYTSPSKECVWCCYHGGHATTLSGRAYVLVRRLSRPPFVMTCVAFTSRVFTPARIARAAARTTLGSRSPPNSNFGPRLKQPCDCQFLWPKAEAALRPNLQAQRAPYASAQAKAAWPTFASADASDKSQRSTCGEKENEQIASHQLRDLLSRA